MDINDRELLELAAKAAGYEVKWRTKADIGMLDTLMVDIPLEAQQLRWKANPYEVWNPLTDDGDALRLAVKLNMVLDTDYNGGAIAGNATVGCNYDEPEHGYQEGLGNKDLYAATRRAIVRAAAVLGSRK